MVNDNRRQLSGLVEVDETFIGGPVKGTKGRGVGASQRKSLVVGAVEVLVSHDKNRKRRERAGDSGLRSFPMRVQTAWGRL